MNQLLSSTQREVELLAIGAGPSNLALAVALEELAPDCLASNALIIEQAASIGWQRGMLLPWTQTQVSFLKDLVTLRNPTSPFSFLNYLHSVGRLNDFVNLGSFTPYRSEISDYLQWVASSLTKAQVEFQRKCVSIEPLRDSTGVCGWLTHLADGSSIASHHLSIGVGRDPNIPAVFSGLPAGRVAHSTQYLTTINGIPRDRPCRVAVIGGAQSAAEMVYSVLQDLPEAEVTMIMRSAGLNYYQTSKFTNELFYPTFTDEFFRAAPDARQQLLREMHQTNYSGLAPALLDGLYRHIYQERLAGKGRLRMITLADVIETRLDGDDVILTLADRKSGQAEELACDLVLLGTGFSPAMPALIQGLGRSLGLQQIATTREYMLATDGTGVCYLQGVNEATHGIADSLLSVLADRSSEIATDIIARYKAGQQVAAAARLPAAPGPAAPGRSPLPTFLT
jgi:L-ornithine N5-monooxygenase